jgi:hypothetical protein
VSIMSTKLKNFKYLFKIPSLVLWLLIAILTFLLPDVIIIYRYIEANFGGSFAGKIPFFLVIVSGTGYIACLLLMKKSLKNLFYLLPCVVIVWFIFTFQENPNKHIHIPEYVLLAWLVYAALSRDYRGSGILILVFVCTSMLGLVDELEQGIHPGRFYGLSDMLVNTSSALIGVFTILGLRRHSASDWNWIVQLRTCKEYLGFIFLGLTCVGVSMVYLFQVQANEGISANVFPEWLLVWNIFLLINAPLIMYMYRSVWQNNQGEKSILQDPISRQNLLSVRLWLYSMIIILFYMHLLIAYTIITGTIFK